MLPNTRSFFQPPSRIHIPYTIGCETDRVASTGVAHHHKERVVFLFRRFPIFGIVLMGWLFLTLAQSASGGILAGLLGLALLPFLLFKMMLLMFVMSMVFGSFGRGPRHHYRRHGRPRRPTEVASRPRDPEWEKNVRDARSELDRLYPDEV